MRRSILTILVQVECYQRALKLDQYLAVAYFQQGVSNFLIGDFEEALANFNDTLLYLRGNSLIDYSQLGLLFKLYSCEVLFNRGLCYIYLEQIETGMQDLEYAVREKVVEDHNVIDDAIKAQAKVCVAHSAKSLGGSRLTFFLSRTTPFSQSPWASSTGQTRPRCETCNKRTI
jgi:tetratricopeptide (TPR) repeat protein